jgi:amino acid adenylation domain-containing protein
LNPAAAISRLQRLDIPTNLIPTNAQNITPQMLPLIELNQEQIDCIAACIPGGVSNIQDIYPLLPMQEALLFHHNLNRHRDVHIAVTVLELESQERLDGFIGALQEVIGRHDILRTAILWERLPKPVQVVCRRAGLSVQTLDVDPDKNTLGQLEACLEGEMPRLDLRNAPLLRLLIAPDMRTGRRFAMLLLHHLVFDGQSIETLIAEVKDCLAGRSHLLLEPVPYRNYVAQMLACSKTRDATAYFRKKLGDVAEPSGPFGILDAHGDGRRLDESSAILDAQWVQRLRTVARREHTSTAALFHVAWGLVVAHAAGRDDIVYGTVLFSQQQTTGGSRPKLGAFINSLPLRMQLGEVSTRELLARTHRDLLELLTYEHASLAMAQRCSGIPATSPLSSTLLNCRHSTLIPGSEWTNEAAGVRTLENRVWTSFSISITVNDMGQHIALTAQTDQRINAQRVIGYLRTAVQSVLGALEKTPELPALRISIIPAEERQDILKSFNDTTAALPNRTLIHELFEQQVERTPDAIALEHETRTWTYAELNGRANRLARYLRALGSGPEQLVGLLVERGVDMIVGLLGILKSGGAYVPLDPAYPAARLQSMLDDAAPRVVLTQRHLKNMLPPLMAVVVELDSDWDAMSRGSSRNLQPSPLGGHPDSLAYVIYTSGTTGAPKGVMVEHGGVVNFLASMQRRPGISGSDRVLAVTTVSFDIAGLEIYLPLISGARLVLASRETAADARLLIQSMQDREITALQATPATWQMLLSAGWTGCPGLKAVCGGEALSNNLAAQLLERVNTLWNLYGPTETTIWSTGRQITHVARDGAAVESIGKPIANTRIYILDERWEPVPIGVVGEIYIGGVGVARGYRNRPELTAQRFLPDLFEAGSGRIYRTGDLGRWRSDGNIEYLGRNDTQIKIRGVRLELGEIEARLTAHANVAEAVVLARQDVNGEKRVVAYVIPKGPATPNPALSAEELRTYLRTMVPEPMIPSAFVVLERFPLTPSGKLDRRALPEPRKEAYTIRRHEAPQGEIETKLAVYWRELLGVEQVGRDDNFFELGGHSLTGTRLIAKIAADLGIDAPVVSIFRYPTLRQMATLVGQLRETSRAAPPVHSSQTELEGVL